MLPEDVCLISDFSSWLRHLSSRKTCFDTHLLRRLTNVSLPIVYVSEPPCFTLMLLALVFSFGLFYSQSQQQEPSLTITTSSLNRFSFCLVLPEEETLMLDMSETEFCN